jgi:VWFA-related protein
MRKALAYFLAAAALCAGASAQTPAPTAPQQNQQGDEEVVRITTQLIQVDAVVTDKDDRVIPDLKLEDFSLYENGKKQDLQFIEFVGAGSPPRLDGNTNLAGTAVASDLMRNVSAQNLHRVFAFVVDDLTIPVDEIANVRAMLTDFVDNKMRDDDLVAIVRVVGGRGLLEQFTSDKPLLRRAISEIGPTSSPYSAFNNLPTPERLDKAPVPFSAGGAGEDGAAPGAMPSNPTMVSSAGNGLDYDATPDAVTQSMRAISALSLTGQVVDNMKPLPGRKSLVLISGGLPAFDSTRQQINVNGALLSVQDSRPVSTGIASLINRLTDRASRAGVVINTLDIRGLKASRGVSGFTDPGNEAKSGLGNFGNSEVNAGRTADMALFDNTALDTLTGHQGLETLASSTGGLSVVNVNNFREALDRVVGRSSYYILAYRPSETFDGKFHKLQIKVDRPGTKVYSRTGYFATADQPASKPLTREEQVVKAAMSPLARRDVDLSGALQYRFTPDNRASIDVDLRIDASKLDLKQGSDGKYHATLDVVGFLLNRAGKTEQGFSETVNAALSPDEYKRALDSGIGYTGHVELPPGSYQLRAVVREADTGKIGSLSKYVEVPDMTKKRLEMSSVFLHAVPPGTKQGVALTALRQISRKDDLRYSAIVYNPKLQGGKAQLSAQLIIARPDKVIFNGPVQALEVASPDGSQVAKVGQIGLSKLQPGHYTLTFIITDALADKKSQTLARSIDFQIVD